jgi:hypothetical protein
LQIFFPAMKKLLPFPINHLGGKDMREQDHNKAIS